MFRSHRLVRVALLVAGLVLWLNAPAPAADARTAEAMALVDKLGAEVVQALQHRDTGIAELEKRFQILLARDFDVPFIGRFVLGRFWGQASAQQQQDYMKLFESLIVKTYANRFIDYSDQKLKVKGGQDLDDRDVVVNSTIERPNGPPVNVDWRVRRTGSILKIIDVAVSNVSLAVSQRSEYASVIQNAGGRIDALLEIMRKQQVAAVGSGP